MPAKIGLFDIETFPAEALVWAHSKYQQDVIEFKRPWEIASFAYKWLGSKKTICHARPDFKGDEKALVGKLHDFLDEADVVIAHNAKFDVGRALAKFAKYKFTPPTPYLTICTYKMSKPFGFSSRKLDDLAAEGGIGRKLPHQGKHTWLGCMASVDKYNDAWNTMRRYNIHDVDPLLEGVYNWLKPFSKHPLLTMWTRDEACGVCQSKHLQSRGLTLTKTGQRQRYQCMECGAWRSALKHEKTT